MKKLCVIEFEPRLTTLVFYNNFLNDLLEKLRNCEKSSVFAISLEKAEYIDSKIIPNILALGDTLKNSTGRNVRLFFRDNNQINFLNSIKFFQASKKAKIFDYDEELVEFAINMNNKEYKHNHKVNCYNPLPKYYDIESEEERIVIRNELFEMLRFNKIPSDYRDVLENTGNLSQDSIFRVLNIFSEIICNSILYSKSKTYSFIQSNRYGASISVSDTGIGFVESLRTKGYGDFRITNKYKNKRYFNRIKDLLAVVEVLEYSRKKDRENLWVLKDLIVNNGGILRIHHKSTQVIFTANRCKGCRKEPEKCIECLMNNSYEDKTISAVRIFDVSFRGVHIEIDLKHEGV